jgi:NitT/TauT family transport system substrate-binding protein
MNKNFFRLSSFLVLLTLILSACGGAASAPKRPPLKVAWSVWPGSYPLAIAQTQGFFAKHGVQVEIVYYPNYVESYVDYATGKVDGLNIALGDLLPLIEKRESKVVLVADTSEGIDEIVALDEIVSPADLKGKRIGVNLGTYGEFFVRKYLQENNIAVTDVTLVNAPVESSADFFPSQVDAIHSYYPYSADAMKRGGHDLATSADVDPLTAPSVFAFAADVVKERPEDIRAFVAAYFEAVDWMYAHESEIPAAVAQAVNLKPEDIFMGGDRVWKLAENQTAMTPGTGTIYAITNEYIDFLVKAGRLTTKPNLDELFDASFLK